MLESRRPARLRALAESTVSCGCVDAFRCSRCKPPVRLARWAARRIGASRLRAGWAVSAEGDGDELAAVDDVGDRSGVGRRRRLADRHSEARRVPLAAPPTGSGPSSGHRMTVRRLVLPPKPRPRADQRWAIRPVEVKSERPGCTYVLCRSDVRRGCDVSPPGRQRSGADPNHVAAGEGRSSLSAGPQARGGPPTVSSSRRGPRPWWTW
jgi:hypothetical protein